MKYAFTAVILLFLIGCEKADNVEIYNENNTNVKNGVVYNIDEKPINGVYKTYYGNGSIKMEMSAKNGIPNGEGRFYDENGNLQYSGNFEAGKINGKLYQYYEDGTIHNELNYTNGNQEGPQILYDNKGQISAEITYSNNKPTSGYVIIEGEKIELDNDEISKLSDSLFSVKDDLTEATKVKENPSNDDIELEKTDENNTEEDETPENSKEQ